MLVSDVHEHAGLEEERPDGRHDGGEGEKAEEGAEGVLFDDLRVGMEGR